MSEIKDKKSKTTSCIFTLLEEKRTDNLILILDRIVGMFGNDVGYEDNTASRGSEEGAPLFADRLVDALIVMRVFGSLLELHISSALIDIIISSDVCPT